MKKQDDQVPPKVQDDSEDLKAQIEEWKNKYMRALADYQNLEKRASDQMGDVRKFAAERILSRLLPVVDTFGKVSEHVKDAGLGLALKELHAVLSEQGVEKMNVVGLPFDPHEMECIEVVEGPENEVIEEVLPGFRLYGKILRVAQVKVGKK
jgi:molecular chaperone GrpE